MVATVAVKTSAADESPSKVRFIFIRLDGHIALVNVQKDRGDLVLNKASGHKKVADACASAIATFR